jgi:2-C-methyl-D-erythritol 2,4-cyclodiphosphate synthase
MKLRIGHGIDLHRMVEGRRCILGGVEIPSTHGPDAHSDGDALLHALTDAILGATGGRDIGFHFPNTDERWRNADSMELLRRMNNADVTILLEKPKIGPAVAAMKDRLAAVLNCGRDEIGIKATTAEKLGALGRGEGVLASAVVLLVQEQTRPLELK